MPASPDGYKTCTKCGERKKLSEFFKNSQSKSDGVMSRCKVCKKKAAAEWAENNRDRRNDKKRTAAKHPERVAVAKARADNPAVKERNNLAAKERARNRTFEEKIAVAARRREEGRRNRRPRNSERDKAYRFEYARREKSMENARQQKRRKLATPSGNIDNRMSSSIWRAVNKGNKSWVSLVGYGLNELMSHLERQLTSGMGWHNFGEWHIDHIVPKSSFTYSSTDDPEFLECWSLSNLRPLFAKENFSKGAKQMFLL